MLNLFKRALTALVYISDASFDTHIVISLLPMSNGKWVKYGIFGIFDINDTYGIQHLSCLYMAKWVSKAASGPQEYRKSPLNKL